MNKSSLKTLFVLSAIIILPLFILDADAFARAGGGVGRGGGVGSILTLPFILLSMAIFAFLVYWKSKNSRELLDKLKVRDKSWDPDAIKQRVTEVFYKVQYAWQERNQDLAIDYMTESLYRKHKMQTDEMIANHKKNVLNNISLADLQVVEVKDFIGDSNDTMWVYIKGSMIDFTVHDQTNEFMAGSDTRAEVFKELWKFKKGPAGWVVDEIDPEAEIKDLVKMHSFSQELGQTP